MEGQALKGHLDMLVLAVIKPKPLHGYGVIQSLRELSDGSFDLPEGTVYPVLHRLERAGHLSGSWSVVGGRRRREYRLTRSGRKLLGQREGEWSLFARAVEAVLEGAP